MNVQKIELLEGEQLSPVHCHSDGVPTPQYRSVYQFVIIHSNKSLIHTSYRSSMLEYSMMDCMFSRYIYPANGSQLYYQLGSVAGSHSTGMDISYKFLKLDLHTVFTYQGMSKYLSPDCSIAVEVIQFTMGWNSSLQTLGLWCCLEATQQNPQTLLNQCGQQAP